MNDVCITLDIDWSPDFIIQSVAELLIRNSCKATWFVTHDSEATRALRKHPELFELGIHPNFKPGSSHGETTENVFRFFKNLVPDAVSMRAHGLIQSDYIWRHLVESTDIRVDCTTYLAHARNLEATDFYWKGGKLVRVPFFYQDNIEMDRPNPIWRAADLLDKAPGLQILNFHPIYVYLNARSMRGYERISERARPFQTATPAVVDPEIEKGAGAGAMFKSVVEHIAGTGRDSWIRTYAGAS